MKIVPRALPGLFLASMLLSLCFAAQPALGLSCPTGGCSARQQLAVDGSSVCGYLNSLAPVTLNTTSANTPTVQVTGTEANNACQQLQSDLYNHSGWPSLWELSQTIAATLDVGNTHVTSANLRSLYATDVLNAFSAYRANAPAGQGGSCPSGSSSWTPNPPIQSFCGGLPGVQSDSPATEYYDDNAWVGSDLVQAYHWSSDPLLLDAAEGLFRFEQTGLDGPVSIYFSTDRVNRGVVANADAAKFATDLAQVDKNENHPGLQYPGERAFANAEDLWIGNNLQRTSGTSPCQVPNTTVNGVFCDHVDTTGAATGTAQSYAYGLMTGLPYNLFLAGYTDPNNASRNPSFFQSQATSTAGVANSYFQSVSGTPPNNDYPDLEAECPAFDAVLFHYLWQIAGGSYNTSLAYHEHLGDYVQFIKGHTTNGLFTAPWLFIGQNDTEGAACSNPNEAPYPILPQAGITRTLIDTLTGL